MKLSKTTAELAGSAPGCFAAPSQSRIFLTTFRRSQREDTYELARLHHG
jgi:hypothetical protein